MNAERLLKLADLLDDIPDDRFNYGHWASADHPEEKTLAESCGTTACALGWATAIPEFGLTIRRTIHGAPAVCLISDPLPPRTSYVAAIDAAAEVFDLDRKQFDWLFSPDDDDEGRPGFEATPAQVAEHIRHFVDNDGELVPCN